MIDALVNSHLGFLLIGEGAQVEAHSVELLLHLGENSWKLGFRAIILMEHIEPICSLDSKLQFGTKYSFENSIELE